MSFSQLNSGLKHIFIRGMFFIVNTYSQQSNTFCIIFIEMQGKFYFEDKRRGREKSFNRLVELKWRKYHKTWRIYWKLYSQNRLRNPTHRNCTYFNILIFKKFIEGESHCPIVGCNKLFKECSNLINHIRSHVIPKNNNFYNSQPLDHTGAKHAILLLNFSNIWTSILGNTAKPIVISKISNLL